MAANPITYADIVRMLKRHVDAFFNELEEAVGTANLQADGPTSAPTSTSSIPEEFRLIESRKGETYDWPTLHEEYETFDVFEGRSADGDVSMWALGKCLRARVWGRDRQYYIVFWLGSGGGSKQPIAEFLEVDDFSETSEFVAIIRGNGGPRGQRMFSPGDDLPAAYQGLRIETYRDRVAGTDQLRGWNKLAVVAGEDDSRSMLRHAAIQVELRHRFWG